MDAKGSSSLSWSHLNYGEDDFLSRRVNLSWDGDSEWNYTDESTDILSFKCDVVNQTAFSREPSTEELVLHGLDSSRKSSLEKPVGQIMLLKPKPFMNESIRSSFWGKFLSKENSRELSNEDDESVSISASEQPRISKNATNNATNEFKTVEQNQDNAASIKSSLAKRSKSVDVVCKSTSCAKESVRQPKDVSILKQTSKDSNKSSQNRRNAKTKQHFSVYSKNFHLNSRFLSKSYYPMSYWRPNISFPLLKERAYSPNESEFQFKTDKTLTFAAENRDVEIERIRHNFDTEKQFRSWIWEPEAKHVQQTALINKKQKCNNNKNENQKQSLTKTPKNVDKTASKEKSTKAMSNRQHQNSLSCSSISLPAIFTQSVMVHDKRPTYNIPSLSCDDLLRQYQKQHVDLIKVSPRRKNDRNSKQKSTKKT